MSGADIFGLVASLAVFVYLVYALFRGERPENLLQPTSVVNELFLKLIRQRSLRFEDREHFYSLSARLMRRVLVDHARSEGRQKRDGGIPVPLHADLGREICFHYLRPAIPDKRYLFVS